MRRDVASAAVLAATFSSCDLPASSGGGRGPAVLSISPPLTPDDVDRGVVWRIELDRRIAPSSLYQSVVEVRSNEVYVYVDMSLDLVRPAIVVRPTSALDPDVDYDFIVHGLTDLDGFTSADTERVRFHTSEQQTPVGATTVTYDDVAPLFAHCASGACHDADDAVSGLDLSSAEGLRSTAIGVPATAVAPGGSGALTRTVTAALIGLPRIASGDPGRSYLLYTMVGDEHIVGQTMPPDALFSDDEIALVQEWIRGGVPGV